ncbi:MAG TPA: FHA domain-containing protein [Streptosporangiaceae bacterium]|nr:FHA domain-containing protein [Streptosporangiaceae bacterium]
MPTCPAGHDSGSDDFCDLCGIRIGSHPAAVPGPRAAQPVASGGWAPGWFDGTPSQPSGPSRPYVPAPAPPAQPCPRCATGRTGQFCEVCGYDFESGSGPVTLTAWVAEVGADRAYFDQVVALGGEDAATLRFPVYCPRRRFRLSGREVRIGRRSVSRGIEPEIDLTGPPTDPGVSRLHAVLVPGDDGRLAVIDPGSENGTLVNGREIPPGVPVPLSEGDVIYLGAWTAIHISSAHL